MCGGGYFTTELKGFTMTISQHAIQRYIERCNRECSENEAIHAISEPIAPKLSAICFLLTANNKVEVNLDNELLAVVRRDNYLPNEIVVTTVMRRSGK